MASLKFTIIAVLMITGIAVGMFQFSNSMFDAYNVSMGENVSATEEAFQTAFSDTEAIGNKIQEKIDKSGGINVVDGIGILTLSALAGIKAPFDIIEITGALFKDLSSTFGVPAWVFALSTAVILILLVFAVYAAILRTPRV